MGKGVCFVAIYTIVLVVLFCICCVLMSLINPEPIVTTRIGQTTPFPQKKDSKSALRYGLERATPEEIKQFLRTSEIDEMDQRYLYFLPNRLRVITPDDSANGVDDKENSSNVTHVDLTISNNNHILIKTPDLNESLDAEPLLKKDKRRSINSNSEFNTDSKVGALILKIIDNIGATKVEIKIQPDALRDGEIKPLGKDKFEMKNTVIRILPNNSVLLDQPEYEVFTGFTDQKIRVSNQINNGSTQNNSFTPTIKLKTLDSEQNNSLNPGIKLETLDSDKLLMHASNGTRNVTCKIPPKQPKLRNTLRVK